MPVLLSRFLFCILLGLLTACSGGTEENSSLRVKSTLEVSTATAVMKAPAKVADAASESFGEEELILPFRQDDPHILTRAYNNSSHRKYPHSDERFALDFAKPGCSGFRAEVIAPLSGRVSVNRNPGQGNNVLITRDDGLSCRLAHLDEILVQEGAVVLQGEPVGREGNTGGVQGRGCRQHPGTHIHLACYRDGKGVPPEPISGYSEMNTLISRTLVPQNPALPLPVLTAALAPLSQTHHLQ